MVIKICRILTLGFGVAYLLALGLFLIGNYGLFGQARDPLAGLFLMPLGLPWNRFIDWVPEGLLPWVAAAMPGLNLAILALICWRRGGAGRPGRDRGSSGNA
ncbi:hypothetical protein ACQ5SP_08350 [Rhodovulum sp. YNF3179]|uniref:hypothetical protein n=1 Tax=Rhodovulum sp. YNF3179 TaxID=3425127 RepID=UPI003D338BED